MIPEPDQHLVTEALTLVGALDGAALLAARAARETDDPDHAAERARLSRRLVRVRHQLFGHLLSYYGGTLRDRTLRSAIASARDYAATYTRKA